MIILFVIKYSARFFLDDGKTCQTSIANLFVVVHFVLVNNDAYLSIIIAENSIRNNLEEKESVKLMAFNDIDCYFEILWLI